MVLYKFLLLLPPLPGAALTQAGEVKESFGTHKVLNGLPNNLSDCDKYVIKSTEVQVDCKYTCPTYLLNAVTF